MVQYFALATSQNLQKMLLGFRWQMPGREPGLLAAQLFDKEIIEPFGLSNVMAAVDRWGGALRMFTQQCAPGLDPRKGDLPL